MSAHSKVSANETTDRFDIPPSGIPRQRGRAQHGAPPGSERTTTRVRPPATGGGVAWLLIAAAIGSLVAVSLGVYGRLHEPQTVAINLAGFSSGLSAKAWLASVVFVLALVQTGSAIAMYRRRRPPAVRPPVWVPVLHRWSGRAAVVVSVPIAVHCLYALGFQDFDTRVLVHSLAGCFFYGVFVTKMLVLQRPRSPRWALPVLGGAVFTVLTAIWLTSSVWFFSTSGLTF
jgi:hypothetical protein